eukprot:3707692-Rhodomonas_salina.3
MTYTLYHIRYPGYPGTRVCMVWLGTPGTRVLEAPGYPGTQGTHCLSQQWLVCRDGQLMIRKNSKT